MNLIVDIGNSSVKAAVFDGDTLLLRKRLRDEAIDGLAMIAEDFDIHACALVSVGSPHPEIADFLSDLSLSVLSVNGQTPTPLICDYQSPETLGADRLAVAVAAAGLMPHVPLLIVDAGTCITYEYVSADGHYLGGNISPGLGMRLRSMHEHTAKLPLVNILGDMPTVGVDTATAIRAGVVRGMDFEIEGYIRSFQQSHSDGVVFMTGGNASRFVSEIEVIRNDALVEIGLNRILQYNNK